MKVQKMNNRYLILEDGSSYQGIGFGAPIIATGELAVETANFGYQESLTDQTNSGRILVFTTPIIGASGISAIDYESINPSVKGIVVNELAIKIAGSHSFQDLDQFLREKNIPGIYQIDTRNIVKKLAQWTCKKPASWTLMTNMQLTKLKPWFYLKIRCKIRQLSMLMLLLTLAKPLPSSISD